MRKEANKQSKFKHYILTPIKILKGVTACAGGFAGCGADEGVVQISHLNSSRANGDERQRELLRTVPIIKATNKSGRNYCMVQNNIINNNMTFSTFGQVSCCYCQEPHGSGPSNYFPEQRAAMHGERTMPIRNNVGNQTRVVMHGEKVLTIRNNAGKETRVVMHSHRQRQPNYVGYKYNRKKMSYYSDGVRKMGRIDEDKACSFEEDQNDSNKAHLLYLYPRTRTNYVVNRRPVYYQ